MPKGIYNRTPEILAKLKNNFGKEAGFSYWKGKHRSEDTKEKLKEYRTGKKHSAETIEKMKSRWLDPEYKNEHVKKSRQAMQIKPNKQELKLIDLLNQVAPNEWKYVGNGEIVIAGRNPDAINVNGVKAVALLHGIYWHLWKQQKDNPTLTKEDVEKEDKEFYKTYGWDCLIVWEDELSNIEQVKEKIKVFCNQKGHENEKEVV